MTNWVCSRSLDIGTKPSWVHRQSPFSLASACSPCQTDLNCMSNYRCRQVPTSKNISVKRDDWKCQEMRHHDGDSSFGDFILNASVFCKNKNLSIHVWVVFACGCFFFFNHSSWDIMLCFLSFMLCSLHIWWSCSSGNSVLKLCTSHIKLSWEPSQEIHLLSHTLMSSLSPSPSLSSITRLLLQERNQHGETATNTNCFVLKQQPLTRRHSKGLF